MRTHLINFSTYGARLHGDPRGSYDRGVFVPHNPGLARYEASIMREAALSLDAEMRRTVVFAIRDACQHRGWLLSAVHARTQHVHVVATFDVDSHRAVAQLKARCTRVLVERGLVASGRPIWSRGGNATRLEAAANVVAACDYVVYRQGEALAVWAAES